MLTSKSMQNSVLSAEAGSASLQGIRVMSAKSGLDLLPGFTSNIRCRWPPSLGYGFSCLVDALRVAREQWCFGRFQDGIRTTSPFLEFYSCQPQSRFLLNIWVFFSVSSVRFLAPSFYPHCNVSSGQRPAFSSDAALASSTIPPFRERSTPTDVSFTYDQRRQRGLGFSGPEYYSCRIIWSSSSVSSPPTRRTISIFWSPHLVLVPIALSDRDCPSICSVICEEECYRGEAPKNLEPCP
jgi:hypothetical protein